MSQNTLPSTAGSWRKQANTLTTESIFDVEKYNSGSEIKLEQFLLLRILWKQHDISTLNNPGTRSKWLSKKHYENSMKQLSSPLSEKIGWAAYLATVRSGLLGKEQDQALSADLGTFSLVLHHQRAIERTENSSEDIPKFFSPVSGRTRRALTISQPKFDEIQTPSKTGPASNTYNSEDSMAKMMESIQLDASPDTPETSYSTQSLYLTKVSPMSEEFTVALLPSEDEQIVSTALIDFLNALTIHFTLPIEFTLHRKAFHCKDSTGRGFEARVDGYLRRKNNNTPLAILEVKPYTRDRKPVAIQMQEGAQMAAWISSYPDFCSKRSHKNKNRT